MFIGENLTNLRTMHGYSRKRLSELLNVTEQAVWQYENNYTTPKLQIINDLKVIFNVKAKYFYKKGIINRYFTPNNIEVMNIAYRSEVINVISKTQSEAKFVELLDSFVNYLSPGLRIPTNRIIQLRDEVIEYLNNSHEERNTQISYIAKLARNRLGFRDDSNDNLLFLIEKSGVFTFERSIGDYIDAYSLWTNEDRPFIILGNLKRSAVRRNFDIAHELGHLLLHYKTEFASLDRKEYKAIEKEADLFAGTFLLPEQSFLEEMESIERKTNPDAYMDLKQRWKTSLQVLGYRAANLEILDAKGHRNFYAALHRKGYLKKEPLDDSLLVQKPQKIKTIIDFVSQKGLIDIQKMMETDWMVEVDFFSRLTGIDQAFFEKYLVQKQDFNLISVKEFPS